MICHFAIWRLNRLNKPNIMLSCSCVWPYIKHTYENPIQPSARNIEIVIVFAVWDLLWDVSDIHYYRYLVKPYILPFDIDDLLSG